MKSIPVSVRLSPVEAEFLARLSIPDAVTPSDKLRAIINDARRHDDTPEDYPCAKALVGRWLNPSFERIYNAEIASGRHSALLAASTEWLQELLTFLLLQSSQLDLNKPQRLEDFEGGMLDRMLGLSETVFQYSLTENAHCYRPDAVSSRLHILRELAQHILEHKKGNSEHA